VLLAVAYFMTTVDLTVVNVSLPTIGRDLHFSATSLQWVVTAYALTYGGFLLLGGRIADLFGRRRVLMSAVGVFAAASLGCALAPSDAVLIGCRAIQGVGAAVMLPTAMSIVTSIFEEGPERNKALGIWGALGATGGTIGLLTGGTDYALCRLAVHLLSQRTDRHARARARPQAAAQRCVPRDEPTL
jgi:MFS family permease